MLPIDSILEPIRRRSFLGTLRAEGRPEGFASALLVACVPVRDEEDRIEACLRALDHELDPGDGVILFSNSSRDATVASARSVTRSWRRPVLLVDGEWAGEGTAPLARRVAFDIAVALAPGAALFSTDGDTVVQSGLRGAFRREFDRGADLVCGAIGFPPAEAALLPQADPAADSTLREYRELSRHLAALVAPDPDNPWPHHGNIGGANFAISAAAYRKAGPLPTPPSGEDRALRARCRALALRVRYSTEARVLTSCRLDGRARGGLADELKRNRTERDPLVDEALEKPETLQLRLVMEQRFRKAPTAAEREAILLALEVPPAQAGRLAVEGGGVAWLEAENLSASLKRSQLRQSDLQAHLPALRELLQATREAPSGRAGGSPSEA